MRANVSPAKVERAGKAIHQVQKVCEVFEKQTTRHLSSDTHPYPSFGKDFSTTLKCLLDEQVFKKESNWSYPSFSIDKNILALSAQRICKRRLKDHFLK